LSKAALPPAVYVCNVEQARLAARCAARLKSSVLLLCPAESAAFGGVPWFKALTRAASQETGATCLTGLEAGEDAALAHEALQAHLDLLVFEGGSKVRERLTAMARAQGATLVEKAPPALSLVGAPDPEARCLSWLERGTERGSELHPG